MIKAHKIRLNPTSEQKTYFYRASGVARFAWNWALDEYKRRKAARQEIDWNEIKMEFRARIKTEFPFVREVTKCAAEVAIAELRGLGENCIKWDDSSRPRRGVTSADTSRKI